MRRLLAALLAVFMLFSLASCETGDDLAELPVTTALSAEPSAEPSTAPNIVIPVGPASVEAFGVAYSSTATLNPITGQSRLNLELAPLMYQGLFRISPEFEAEAALCTNATHSGEVWTFKLKRGVKMSDGEQLTSADVKYSIDLARTSDRYSARLGMIRLVETPDDTTVLITTNGVYGRLELLLDIPIIRADSGEDYAPVGSGLYEYVDAGDESYLRVASSHRGEGSIARIQLIDTPAAELMISNFEQGLVSVTSRYATATDRIDYGGDYEEWNFPTTNMIYLCFGSRYASELNAILADAVDREAVAEFDLLGYADATDSAANPHSAIGAPPDEFSLERSAEKLESLGAVVGEDGVLELGRNRLSLRLIVPEENDCKLAAAERIAEDWRQLGIDVTLDMLSFAEFKTALASGNFDAALCETRLRADFSLDALLGAGGSLNFGGHYSEELETLLANFGAADADGIERAADELYRYIDEYAPIAPIAFTRGSLIARRGEVGAPDPSASDLYRGVESW